MLWGVAPDLEALSISIPTTFPLFVVIEDHPRADPVTCKDLLIAQTQG